MPFMYILLCGDGTYYTGSTRDLTTRLEQHYAGMGGDYTSKRMPVEFVYGEEFDRIDQAYLREKQIQNWSHAKRDALARGDFEQLRRLAKKKRSS